VIERACDRALVAAACADGIRRLGFESGHLTVDAHAALLEVAASDGGRGDGGGGAAAVVAVAAAGWSCAARPAWRSGCAR